jgi:signal transduction histidine kinase
MADLVWREQQALLHTLHDSLGQTLTGLGMLSAGLQRRLIAIDGPSAATAQQIAEQAQVALEQVRQLSQGLFPIEIEAEGLMPALRALASTTESFHGIHVVAEGEVPGRLRDSRIATEVYRIAQEAVTNAVKHADARTITIDVTGVEGLTRLRVADDGVGIREESRTHDGLGLRIMRYRATSIGAALSIERGATGGTVVTCTLRETPGPAAPADVRRVQPGEGHKVR